MASYLSVTAYLNRSDVMSVSRLCARGVPAATGKNVAPTPLTASDLGSDPVLAAALLDAAGEILAACLQGDRYTDVDLNALTDNGQAKLYRLQAQLTTCHLWENRHLGANDIPQPEFYVRAFDDLERLRRGERMFG